MKIREISIRNLKSFGDDPVTIPLNDLTALVGANSSGKSNVLKALELFFNYSSKLVIKEIFHRGDASKPIEITVTFISLDDNDKTVFKRNLSPDGSLRIRQRIALASESAEESPADADDSEPSRERFTQEKRGLRVIAVQSVIDWLNLAETPTQEQVAQWWSGDLKVGNVDLKERFESDEVPSPESFQKAVNDIWNEHLEDIPPIDWLNLDKVPSKTEVKNWWKTDLIVGGVDLKSYFADPKQVPDPADFRKAVDRFWDEHGNVVPVMTHEGSEKVLGWANKLKGNLPRLVFIPAIRHVHEEIKVAKTNPFGMIVNWLLGDIPQKRKDDLQKAIDDAIASVFARDPQAAEEKRRIELIRETMNELMKDQFDIALDFRFPPPRVQDMLGEEVEIIGDDGYPSLIQEKGQGVQRSMVFTVLRTYSKLRGTLEKTSAHRNTIFALEEPEICLHPAVRRATYNLLHSISVGEDQVIYTTHDGYFVDVRHFDEVRLLRRVQQADNRWVTQVSYFPIENLIRDRKNRYNVDATADSIRGLFGRFYDPAKNEGFFAKKVILVEGETEEHALPIYFRALGFDLDREQIAIIGARGVQNLDYLYIVFNELGIPCYVILDGDKPNVEIDELSPQQRDAAKKRSWHNRDCLTVIGAPEIAPTDQDEFAFPPTTVHPRVTIFEHEFEVGVHHALPNYDELKAEATDLYGKDAKPLTARHIASRVVESGTENIPQLVRDVLDQVKACEHHGTCLMLAPVANNNAR